MRSRFPPLLLLLALSCTRDAATVPATIRHDLPSGWTLALDPGFVRNAAGTAVLFTARNRSIRARVYDDYDLARAAMSALPQARRGLYRQGRKTAEVFETAPNRRTVFVFFDRASALELDIAFESASEAPWADGVWQSVRRR